MLYIVILIFVALIISNSVQKNIERKKKREAKKQQKVNDQRKELERQKNARIQKEQEKEQNEFSIIEKALDYNNVPLKSHDLTNRKILILNNLLVAIKTNDSFKINEKLDQLYNLALISTFCYGSTNELEFKSQEEYKKTAKWLSENFRKINKFTYEDNGLIIGCVFLTPDDWDLFLKYKTSKNKSVNIIDLIPQFPAKGNYIYD